MICMASKNSLMNKLRVISMTAHLTQTTIASVEKAFVGKTSEPQSEMSVRPIELADKLVCAQMGAPKSIRHQRPLAVSRMSIERAKSLTSRGWSRFSMISSCKSTKRVATDDLKGFD